MLLALFFQVHPHLMQSNNLGQLSTVYFSGPSSTMYFSGPPSATSPARGGRLLLHAERRRVLQAAERHRLLWPAERCQLLWPLHPGEGLHKGGQQDHEKMPMLRITGGDVKNNTSLYFGKKVKL